MVKNLPYNPGETSLIHGGGTNIPHATGQLSPSTNYWACALWSLHTQLESPVCCKERPHVLPLRPTAAECLECTGSLWILHTQLMVQKNSTFSKEWGGFGSWKKWEPQFRVNTYKYKVKPQRMLLFGNYTQPSQQSCGRTGNELREPVMFPITASHDSCDAKNMPYDWGQFPLELWN